MKFRFVASTATGGITKGVREVENRETLAGALHDEGLHLMSTEELRPTLAHSLARLELGGVSTLEKVLFARHLALMLKSGLSLTESLDVIADQAPHQRLVRVVRDITASVKNGNSLSRSLARHPKVFNALMTSLIHIGESSGTLDINLEYLATQLEKEYELKQKIRAAMLYPAIIFIATLGLGAALSVFVMPKLVKLFEGLDITLPLSTQIFLALARFLADWGLWLIIGLIGFVIALTAIRKIPAVQLLTHRFLLLLPLIKSMVVRTNMTRFSRTLSVLLKSGLPIIDALDITAHALPNAVFRRELTAARGNVEKGKPLGTTLAERDRYFPKMVSRMISVGEKTGKLDETLGYLAGFYEAEVDATTKNLSTVIEPILLIVIGLVVGGLGIAIITPIYQLSGSIGR